MLSSDNLNFYFGSRMLTSLAKRIGLPIDQMNFVICYIIAIIVGYPFRKFFDPKNSSAKTRHLVEVCLGIPLMFFCYGQQLWHMFFHSFICYISMNFIPFGGMEKIVFIISLGHLSICHIYRQIYDYGGYTLDITGPLMINVQRMSSLAFSLSDGHQMHYESLHLTNNMKQHSVKKIPTILEFISYIFSFHNGICGPFIFYDDYISFIEGTEKYRKTIQNNDNKNSTNEITQNKSHKFPSPFWPVVTKLIWAAVYISLTFTIVPLFPISLLKDSDFQRKSFLVQMLLIVIITTAQRQKYYFAWSIADAANNNAGLGISKIENNVAKWDLATNADVFYVEFSTSLKVLLDSWNKTTSYWLRHVVYERLSSLNMLAVFAVSSIWHGFYPGYYLTFFTGALFTNAARIVRRKIRPLFQISKNMSIIYDIITFLFTRIALGYLTFSFVLLEFHASWIVLKYIFFWMHILAILTIVLLPRLFKNKTDFK